MFSSNRTLFIKLKEIVSMKTRLNSLDINRNVKVRFLCDKVGSPKDTNNSKDENKKAETISIVDDKYKIFHDSDAPILLDVYEEKLQLENNIDVTEPEREIYRGLNMERGVQGVYDIEDLVELLRRDRAEDIFVAQLPPSVNYVDYIVVVNGKSKRHMSGLAEVVRRVFKKKRLPSDILPRIEGEGSSQWMALDLGNIALHIFSHNARPVYDLESLWSVGTEFDPLVNAPEDPLIALLEKHSISLNSIKEDT